MKTKLSRTLSCVLGFVAVLCFSLALTFSTQKSPVGATELVSSEILDEYHIGDELTLPETVTISVDNDQTVPGSNGVLVFPDGTVHNSASYYFELEGEYQAIYYGTYEGKQVKASKIFKVLAENWVLSSGKSDMSYEESLNRVQKAGLSVNLAEGDAFVFDQRINLNDVIEEQGEKFNVITLSPEMWVEGNTQVSCQTISVKLVDYYDPNNFIEYYTWASSGAIPYKASGASYTSTTYSGAGASYQDLTGLEYYAGMSESRLVDKFDGRQGKLYRSSRYKEASTYGAVTTAISSFVYPHSKNANFGTETGTKARSSITYKYDNATGEAFCGNTYLTGLKSEYVNPGNTWKGFTTGEVYVQVQCFNYKYGTPVNIEITNILGISGEGLKQAYVKDTVCPVVEFDTEYTDKNGVYIEKGIPFTIPTPRVYDINYEGDLEVAVYYNYGTDNPISVYTKDNVFTPSNFGRYTAVYTATDKYGNKTAARYDMNAVNQKQFIYEQTKLTELSAATDNVIPTIDVVGINIKPDVKVTVTDPKGGVKDVTSTMVYAPEYIGTYKIQYVFSDNATSETFEYEVESKEKGFVLFKDGFKLSSYLIKDAVYDFDDYYVYKATADGLQAVQATIKVNVDNTEFVDIANPNSYKIAGNQTISFQAVYGENTKVIAESKIVDVGFEATDKNYWAYFQGTYEKTMNPVLDAENNPIPDKFTYAGLNNSSINYTFLADTEVKKIDFINPLMLSTFQLDVVVPEGALYNDYRITLTEFGNSANKMVIRYTTRLRGIENFLVIQFIDANGTVLLDKEITGNFVGKHSIFIKDGSFTTTEGATYSAPNFADHRTMVSVEVVSDVDATIGFTKVGNQNFNNRVKRSNEAKPQIYYVRVPGNYTLGSTIEVPKASAVSVLSPILEKDVTVSVTNNDGTEYLSNENGQMKDLDASKSYSFELTYLGLFKIGYKFSASVGKGAVRADDESFVVNCSDSICPEIVWEEGIGEDKIVSFKAGRTHKIKTFTVSDNETAVDKLFVRVLIFNEYYTLVAYDVTNELTFNGEYTFETHGNYIVQAYCQDEAGNYTVSHYNICVLED